MMFLKTPIYQLIFAFFILSLNFSCQNVSLGDFDEHIDIVHQEYAVIKAILKDEPKNYVVFSESINETFGINQEFLKKEFSEIYPDTLENYIKRNKNNIRVYEPPPNFDYSVISKRDSEEKLESAFQYYEFSRVGFSKERNQAFVYFSNICNALCGEGAFYLLKKEDNNWVIIKKSSIWVS